MMRTKIHDEEWPYVFSLLPADIEETAKTSGALVRCRKVPNAEALLRLALAYAVSDLSLKDVAAWATALGLADLTGPGLFYRLREAESWLSQVLGQTLGGDVGSGPKGLRLRAVDATVITGPGAEGPEWRAHVVIDPQRGTMRSVELTDQHGGESYGRHLYEAGEVVLGDRAYALARGIYTVKEAGAYVVARLNPHSLRVCDRERQRIQLWRRAREIPKTGGIEYDIMIPIPPKKQRTKSHKSWPLSKAVAWVTARVVAARTRAGDPIWILTTLPAAQASMLCILQLYRLRWQIELWFKRLKSLLHLDALPSRQGPTAKSWMLARLLAAALGQKLVQPSGPLSPWGYQIERVHA